MMLILLVVTSDRLRNNLGLRQPFLESGILGVNIRRAVLVAVQVSVLNHVRRLGESVGRGLSERETRGGSGAILRSTAGRGALSAGEVMMHLETSSRGSAADRRVAVASEPVGLVMLVLRLKVNVLDLLTLQELLDDPLEALTTLDHVADKCALEVPALSRHVVIESLVAATDADRKLIILLLHVQTLRADKVQSALNVDDGNGQPVLVHDLANVLVELVGLASNELDGRLAEELIALLIKL